jgi:hypothetical protein
MTYAYKPNAFQKATVPHTKQKIVYKSDRMKAWRNLMVSAINYGLMQEHFTLDPDNKLKHEDGIMYQFIDRGLHWLVQVIDIGHGELRFFVGASTDDWPLYWKGEPFEPWSMPIRAWGWLERKKGKWLQSGGHGRETRIPLHSRWWLAEMNVEPRGYIDNGPIMF